MPKKIIRIANCERGNILGRVAKSIEIKASPEKVWEMLAFDRRPEWMEGIKSVKYTSEIPTPEDKYACMREPSPPRESEYYLCAMSMKSERTDRCGPSNL